MSRFRLSYWIVVAVCAASTAWADPITVQNGSFESGSLSGWTLTMSQGVSNYKGQTSLMDAGIVNVVNGFGTHLPTDGNDLLMMETQEGGFFTGGLIDYDVRLSQTVHVEAGNVFSGWAAFVDGDYLPQDTASVRIFSNTGALLDTPWFARSGVDGPTPASIWTEWFWQAPTSGDYTLVLGMGTTGDNNLRSRAFFDDVVLTTPEPPSIALALLLGSILFCLYGRTRKAASIVEG